MKKQKSLKLVHQAKVEIDKKKMDSVKGGVVTPTISDLCYACGLGSVLKLDMAVGMWVQEVCDPIWV